jgi:beta-carotene ketolase (CrtW type)
LSSFQLFTFGTWLPHRNLKIPFADWHRARSNDYPAWLSFLTCYHFGYHWEHHEWPFVPWWKLPRARAMRRMSLSGEKT